MLPFVLILSSLLVISGQCEAQNESNSTADIIRSRGFLAESFNFTTRQGIKLNVVRANNPLILGGKPGGLPNKSVVLLVHGINSNSKGFVLNSEGAKPKNYGYLEAGTLSEQFLVELLKDDPTSNSLCLLLVNFGHECWLYDRRSTRASQALAGPATNTSAGSGRTKRDTNSSSQLLQTVEEEFKQIASRLEGSKQNFNFSFDEQASEDLPQVVDFILKQTRRQKLSLVGYSAGGMITLAALSIRAIARDLLDHVMLWAPAMELGHNKSNIITVALPLLEPLLVKYAIPIDSGYQSSLLRRTGEVLCTPETEGTFVCEADKSGVQNKDDPNFSRQNSDFTSSHELAQRASACRKMRMDKFDYLNNSSNLISYGQSEPPTYNISNIPPMNISVWQGNGDNRVTLADTEDLLRRFRFPVDFHLVSNKVAGVIFNHLSFLLHTNVSQLLNIPCLRRLETRFRIPTNRTWN